MNSEVNERPKIILDGVEYDQEDLSPETIDVIVALSEVQQELAAMRKSATKLGAAEAGLIIKLKELVPQQGEVLPQEDEEQTEASE